MSARESLIDPPGPLASTADSMAAQAPVDTPADTPADTAATSRPRRAHCGFCGHAWFGEVAHCPYCGRSSTLLPAAVPRAERGPGVSLAAGTDAVGLARPGGPAPEHVSARREPVLMQEPTDFAATTADVPPPAFAAEEHPGTGTLRRSEGQVRGHADATGRHWIASWPAIVIAAALALGTAATVLLVSTTGDKALPRAAGTAPARTADGPVRGTAEPVPGEPVTPRASSRPQQQPQPQAQQQQSHVQPQPAVSPAPRRPLCSAASEAAGLCNPR